MAGKSFTTRCVEALITEHDKIPVWSFHIPHAHKVGCEYLRVQCRLCAHSADRRFWALCASFISFIDSIWRLSTEPCILIQTVS